MLLSESEIKMPKRKYAYETSLVQAFLSRDERVVVDKSVAA